MTITVPSILPVGYNGDYSDFLHCKSDREGAARLQTGLVAVPASTTTTTLIGLYPFLPGYKFSYGSAIYTGAQGTGVTFGWGYQYYDSTQPNSGTSQPSGFVSGSTVAAAGGIIVPNANTSINWVAASQGWIVLVVGGATTTGPANVQFNCLGVYDNAGFQPGVSN